MAIITRRSAWSALVILLAAWLLLACTIPEAEMSPAEPETVQEPAPAMPDIELAAGIAEARTMEEQPIEKLPFSTRGWRTTFGKRNVDFNDILSGGPPKDGIPAIDSPSYESIADAADWLTESDPVIVYEHEGVVRAYPLAVLTWHEIVNDELNGRPIAVTFCPLCNASIVFDRRVGTEVLDFGTTGKLRNSDLVMYDRQTESWWQQFTGQAIVGEYTSTQLTFLPSQVLSFGEFARHFPDSEVLRRPLDLFSRDYGSNPYILYDTYGNGLSRGGNLALFSQSPDDRLQPLDRVVGVIFDDQTSVAIPFDTVSQTGVVHYTAGDDIVVFHQFGMSSALAEQDIGTARDIGSIGVFSRVLDGQVLDFVSEDNGLFVDVQTGSTWNIRGQATEGELAGKTLATALFFDHFWFAWAAFLPDTELFIPG